MAKSHLAPPAWQAWGVSIILIVGVVIGCIGTIVGWPVFWVGVGVFFLGLLIGWRVHVMEFTEEYELEGERIEPGTTMLHG